MRFGAARRCEVCGERWALGTLILGELTGFHFSWSWRMNDRLIELQLMRFLKLYFK